MIVRIEMDGRVPQLDYRVTYESEPLYGDSGLESVLECLIAAVEGLPPEAVAAEIWYRGIVSGTYPLQVIGMSPGQIAEHAVGTTTAVEEALGEG